MHSYSIARQQNTCPNPLDTTLMLAKLAHIRAIRSRAFVREQKRIFLKVNINVKINIILIYIQCPSIETLKNLRHEVRLTSRNLDRKLVCWFESFIWIILNG
ncbi:hypothetical protein V1478_005395 [Vespula squamosa]|uniref:Uncharacterized protein n=1 Tax=Vespula squamosa TaxID=30214 RepID=A0ABD2BE14_VESSQ